MKDYIVIGVKYKTNNRYNEDTIFIKNDGCFIKENGKYDLLLTTKKDTFFVDTIGSFKYHQQIKKNSKDVFEFSNIMENPDGRKILIRKITYDNQYKIYDIYSLGD